MGLSHTDVLVDADARCEINYKTRQIENQTGKSILARYDHNSERIGFKIKRYLDEHDMSQTDQVTVIFANGTNSGMYTVDDIVADDDYVTFSWLVSSTATQYAGLLTFAINFRCFDADDGTTVTYNWSTLPCKSFSIAETLIE